MTMKLHLTLFKPIELFKPASKFQLLIHVFSDHGVPVCFPLLGLDLKFRSECNVLLLLLLSLRIGGYCTNREAL